MTVRTKRGWRAFQVACTYIGTVVGAGFASGQEVFQFFGRFGNKGYFAIALATILFAWLGYRLMVLGHELSARSYRELNSYLFGPRLGAVMNVMILVMLFGVTIAMIAGAGELFRERMGISFQIGAIVTMFITFMTILRGIDGIMRANTMIVPLMVGFVLFSALHVLKTSGVHGAWLAGTMGSHVSPLQTGVAAILYSALNIGLAAGVLVPLGADIADQQTLKYGAVIGATGLGAMLVAVLFTLLAHYPQALLYSVPMGYIAAQIGTSVQWLFVAVLWGEIYSTLVGNVFALGAQFGRRSAPTSPVAFLMILGLAYAGSQVGFTNMVAYAYPAFGWTCVLLLIALLWPRRVSA